MIYDPITGVILGVLYSGMVVAATVLDTRVMLDG